jgi:hypothetical protein
MRFPAILTMALLACTAATLLAGDDDALRDALEDHLLVGDWIYDDVDAGYAEAKKTGKPLLVSFRCVP